MLDIERLDELPREDLIALGRRFGIERPERMTRVELRDELVRVTISDEALRNRTRGWFGVARDLVASVVEAGLHMPDAAKVIRGDELSPDLHIKRPPVATVTLAEIYAAQGHVRRAMKMLDQVLQAEPDHEVAQHLRERLAERLANSQRGGGIETPVPPSKRPSLSAVLGDRLGSSARPGEAGSTAEPVEPPESGEVEVQHPAADGSAARPPVEPASAELPVPPATDSAPPTVVDSAPSTVVESTPSTAAEPESPAIAEPEPLAAEPPMAEPEPQSVAEVQALPEQPTLESVPEPVPDAPAPEPQPALSAEALPEQPTLESAPEPVPNAPAPQSSPPLVAEEPGFDHDLLFTVHDAHARIVYWELAAKSIARGRALDPDGRTVLRLVSVKPGWNGAEAFEQEIEIEDPMGRKALVLPEGYRYPRAAIGWRSKAGFLPLAVAMEIGASGELEFVPPALSDEQIARGLTRARTRVAVGQA